jgi:2-methylisocitrate lyase-like PEP mutase family enzyme
LLLKCSAGMSSTIDSRREAFRALHQHGCFVIPNPWDIGTARYLQHVGYSALATTSAGYAFSRGLPDTVGAVARDEMLGHIAELVRATDLPVNADFGLGFADEPDGVAKNVALCIETGVAGLSIEDATGDEVNPLFELPLAADRIRAAREAINQSKTGVLLTARAECYLTGHPQPFEEALRRLQAYSEAGADVLYSPGVSTADEMRAIVESVSPKPVNILMSSNTGLRVSDLAGLGVRRISVGSSLARAAWDGFIRAAKEIADEGSFTRFGGIVSFSELNELFRTGSK